MCKFTRYRIVQDRGLFYIEIPTFVIFWERLHSVDYEESLGTLVHDYEFTTKEDALDFAERYVYKIIN